MEKLSQKKEINRLTLLFAATYMVSYLTRINYGAVVSEMELATSISRSLLSMALTGSFVTYGLGQIISGIVGDKVSPKKLVSLGFIITILMNILIPFCQNAVQMLVVWCVNGFAQSLMWPPMVRLMTALLDEQNYKTTTTKVIWGSSIGTIVVYLVSPFLITFFSWKAVFWFSALCGIVMLLIWNRCSYEIGVHKRMVNTDAPAQKTSWFGPLMAFVMVAIVSQGMLRDGITTWMPTYISDTYHLGSAISILTGVLLPVFSMICCQVCTRLYISRFTNPLTCAGVFFAVGTLAAAGLSLFTRENAAFSVAFTALLTGCMHGVNLILICMIPAFFTNTGKVSAISGILNSCTYVGSAVSTYGIAFLSEKCGWDFTLLMWLGIAALGAVICFSCARSWHRKFGEI